MAVTYTYPGTGTGADSHPYATQMDHALSEPFTLANPLNANEGPGAYSDNMWDNLESLKDPLIQYSLLRAWRMNAVWRQYAPVMMNMNHASGALAESMTFQGMYDIEPTPEPVGRRQIWFPNNYTDTYKQSITFESYADKVALHEYDDRVQAYHRDGRTGLAHIAQSLLGQSAQMFQDRLIRNAYLETPRKRYVNSHTDFSGFTDQPADYLDVGIAKDIWMDLNYMGMPLAQNGNGTNGMMVCVTTPSVIRNLQDLVGSEFYTVYMQTNPGSLLAYEVGAYKNVRFVAHPNNVLWNVGDIICRMPILRDDALTYYSPGDGAPDPSTTLVDGVYSVGQANAATKHEIALNNTAQVGAGAFAVNDIVTIHQTVTSDFGVTDGTDYREGTARQRRIVSVRVDGTTTYLSFDRPLFHEFQNGDYVTKAYDIHPSVFLGSTAGVVTAVADPIMAYPMDPIDDARAIWRFIWKGRWKTQLFAPEVYQVVFSGGTKPGYGLAQGQ